MKFGLFYLQDFDLLDIDSEDDIELDVLEVDDSEDRPDDVEGYYTVLLNLNDLFPLIEDYLIDFTTFIKLLDDILVKNKSLESIESQIVLSNKAKK